MTKHTTTTTSIVDGVEVTKWVIQKYGDKRDTTHTRWTAKYGDKIGRGYTRREAIAQAKSPRAVSLSQG